MDRLSCGERAFALLLRAYPAAHRRQFGHEMQQTFRDLSRERALSGEQPLRFWTGLILDTTTGAAREYIALIRTQPMSLSLAHNANPKTLIAGIGLMVPAGLFFATALISQLFGLSLPIGPHLARPLQLFFVVGVVICPLIAAALGAIALIRNANPANPAGRRPLKRSTWTIALIALALLWIVFLFGHDTVGCASHYLLRLDWPGFAHCNATH